ncbi:hypothetical protein ACSSS7_001065 [Eimeria intestinalis]
MTPPAAVILRRSLGSPLGAPLRLSGGRLGGNHIYLGRFHDYNQWEYLPHPALQLSGAILPVGASTAPPPAKGQKLRGSGLHGPECGEVLRLVLWNRLKQRRKQREVPTVEQMREFNKLEVACVWFTWSILLFFWPLTAVGGSYAKEHERFPWTPERTDGSRGEGPFWWFLE